MAVEFQDYYNTLGVSRGASQAEIQKAYRGLARKHHPDMSKDKGSEDKFKLVSEAYEVLKNPDSRKRYDALGANWKGGQPFSPPQGFEGINFDFGGFGQGGGASGFSSFFESLFGQAFQGQRPQGGRWQQSNVPQRGIDHESEIDITLEDAYFGAKRQVSLQTSTQGSAGIKKLNIKIPAGTTQGTKIRLAGQGGTGGFGGEPGDLYLKIKIIPHEKFQLHGHNIHLPIAITPWEAALGATIEIDTVGQKLKLKIPPGSSSGTKLRLRGKGLPQKNKENGDMIVELSIVVPKKLSEKEKGLFENLKEASKFSPR